MDDYTSRPTAPAYVRLLVVGHSLQPLPNAHLGTIQIRRGLPSTVDVLVEVMEQDTSLRGDPFRWLILGEGTRRFGKRGGCDLYAGIQTSKLRYRGTRVAGNKFDCTQTGERGHAIAQEAGKPALLLPRYDSDAICAFVRDYLQSMK